MTERWCNQVAAEFLVPLAPIRGDFDASGRLQDEVERLARRFMVSTLVILHDWGQTPFIAFDWGQTPFIRGDLAP